MWLAIVPFQGGSYFLFQFLFFQRARQAKILKEQEWGGRFLGKLLPFGQRKRKKKIFGKNKKFYPLQKFPLYFCGERFSSLLVRRFQ